MRVQDLQLYLSQFTKGSDAVKNAVIYVEIKGKLHAIRRMEVHENAVPIIGQPGHSCLLYTSPSPRDGLLSRMPSSA